MQMIKLSDFLISAARTGLSLQKADGSFPSGHNGCWNTKETPVRNTAHWLVTCAKAYELTQDISFKNAVENAGAYLLSSKARPFDCTYHIMDQKGWQTNGLVGQAWVMEALLAAYKTLENDRYLQAAHDLVVQFQFNKELSLWHITTLKGKISKEHTTLNQQIWFTALAHKVGILRQDSDLLEKTTISANNFLYISKFNGKFIHMIVNEKIYLKNNFTSYIQWKWKFAKKWKHFDILSKGYISYSLYALSILHEADKSLSIWKSKGFKEYYLTSIDYMDEYVFSYSVEDNPVAFSYHPTGFEAACILESFEQYCDHPKRTVKDWVEKQINQHYDFQQDLMCKNSNDPITLAARLYEVTRLKDLEIKIESGKG